LQQSRRAYLAHLFANGLTAVSYSGGDRIKRLSRGTLNGTDLQCMYHHQMLFHVGGMLGLAGEDH